MNRSVCLVVLLFGVSWASVSRTTVESQAPIDETELAARQLTVQASPGPASSICAEFNDYMPSECSCVDASRAATMTCQVSVDGFFSLGARLVIDICGTPDIAFYYDAGMGYTLGGQFGLPYSDKIPIPGVSADIPLVGSVGAVAEISASGTLSDISIAFGIGACLGEVCDGQLDVIGRFLPVSLLGVTGIDVSEVAGNICN